MCPTNDDAATVTLCVLLWARAGRGPELATYEDEVLRCMADHDATVLQRVRSIDDAEGPDEVQVLRFSSSTSLDAYLADPRRLALQAARDAAVERTQVIRVAPIE